MANTFKLKTKAGVTSLATVYTVPSSTTALIIGGYVGNTTTSGINATVTVSSDTSDTETNAAPNPECTAFLMASRELSSISIFK